MSLTTTSLADSLPSSIPKLDATGLNWAIFSVRFQDAVEAKGFWGHFDGSEVRPVPSPAPAAATAPTGGAAATPTPAVVVTAEELAAQHQWDKNERSAKSLLTQKIPDSTLMRIHLKKTVKERWDAIVEEYTSKGAYAQTDLRQKFMDMRCPDKGNVREFLDSLRVKREELASVGVDIDEKDYRSTILASLPAALSNFASTQLAAARMWSPTKTIVPDDLISLINEEFDRQKAQRTRRTGAGKSKERDDDEAMAVTPAFSKGRGGRGGRRGGRPHHAPKKFKGECFGCGEKGHYKNNCPNLAKSSKDMVTTSGSANIVAAADWDSEGEGAWVAMNTDGESVTSDGEMPSLESVESSEVSSEDGSVPGLATMSTSSGGIREADSVSEEDSDWFSEVGEDAGELDDEGWSSDDENAPRTREFTLEEYGIDYSDLPDVALVATEPAKPGQ